jgi:hypothetical protein
LAMCLTTITLAPACSPAGALLDTSFQSCHPAPQAQALSRVLPSPATRV